MDFRCPSCQRDLTVPDEYAGQLMKCPLCQNTFQAPALPPPVAPSPPAATEVYGVQHEAPAPAAAPPPQLPQEAPARKPEVPAPPPAPLTPPPPVPTGDYTRTRTIWISPRVVPWIAPLALLLALLLGIICDWTALPGKESLERGAWGWGWSETNALTLLYTLMLLFALLLSWAIVILRVVPGFRPPAALQQVWPWRAFFVAVFAFLAFTFLTLQLIVGFLPKEEAVRKAMAEVHARIPTTIYVWIVWYLQLIALIGSLLEYWLDVRGPGKPIPRIDIHS